LTRRLREGEQNSDKPSRALAPLLDIARRENGPAVLILGNTIKSAAHSRCCGVVEDRADIVYEVRDATELHRTGSRSWLEELPPADAGSWVSRSSRRKQRTRFRLAFVASKFRIGVEPEPFVLEIDLTREPWLVREVTDEIDREGATARQRRAAEKAARLDSAAVKLRQEIIRRAKAGEPPMRKRQDAEPFLVKLDLTRTEARDLLIDRNAVAWTLQPSPEDRRTTHVLPLVKNDGDGHISTVMEGAEIKASEGANCGRPVSVGPATSDPYGTSQTCGVPKPGNVAETPSFSPGEDVELI